MKISPLIFEPYYRPQIWGGRSFERLFQKPLPAEQSIGESWEVSAQSHHVSRIANGPHKGKLLTDLLAQDAAALMGADWKIGLEFPLLVKLLDCQDLLSVQVHPTDELAMELRGESQGKTEAWVVLDAAPNGRILAGLKEGVTRGDLDLAIEAGTIDQCLHSVHPAPGDCYFIPAGTIHAVGGGVVMAEVQQSSDATFRFFDWNRVGPDGKARQLHIAESLRSIDMESRERKPQVATKADWHPDAQCLVACPYFELFRVRTTTSLTSPFTGRMSIWMILEGSASVATDGSIIERKAGETILIPASSPSTTIVPTATDCQLTLLAATLPFVAK